MNSETNSYTIYDRKTDQLAASTTSDGIIHSESNLEAVAILKSLMQRL